MRPGKCLLAACLLATITAGNPLAAAEPQGQGPALEQLQQQVNELTQLIKQIQEQHDKEMASLKAEIEKLQQAPGKAEEPAPADELALLRELAQEQAGGEAEPEKAPEETVFKAAGLSLQKLNPEISAAGDFLVYYQDKNQTGPEGRKRTDAEIRGLELNVQSYLDPFSYMKATVHMSDEHVDIEEVYFTRFSAFAGANLDVGRFRQQFGVVNRWHEDALDQVQYPLALRRIFGHEGLGQTGASLDWTLPMWGQAQQEFVFQVTSGENDALFSGDALGTPSLLFHYKNYRDLSRDAYLEWGVSGLFGWNDEWEVQPSGGDPETKYDALGTRVFGADLSYLWEPIDRALYKNVEWRSELYVLNRDILAPDDTGRDTINAWGGYSYLQSKVARNLIFGVRLDYFEPDSKNYDGPVDPSLALIAYPDKDPCRWQVGPYVTWWQSEWVRIRGEYNYGWGDGMEPHEHIFWGQANFAIGPHKHERY
ncbi:MAG: hypothetical protein JW741_24690 [Sedimentisphaerales bacterium]|nr:hypothetical protein [Sedimentisphaerales bacterium]